MKDEADGPGATLQVSDSQFFACVDASQGFLDGDVGELDVRMRERHRRIKERDRHVRRRIAKRLGFTKLEQWYSWYENVETPAQWGWSSCIVNSPRFGGLTSLVVLINTGYVAYVSNWSMENLRMTPPAGMVTVECVFLSYYAIEILLRIEAQRWYFFASRVIRWNMFDLILVCFSLWDAVMRMILSDASGGNISFMRIVRMVKLANILRTLRVIQVFEDLATIVQSFYKSCLALLWCFVTLAFMLFVFALIFLQGVTGYLEEAVDDLDQDSKNNVIIAFGSLSRTILSLYMAVTGGADWGDYYDMVASAGSFYGFMFLFFTFFFTFAVFNILIGVFVEKAVAAAAPGIESRILQKQKDSIAQSDELRLMMKSVDGDSSGTISRREFEAHMKNEFFVNYLSSIGLEVHDARFFFDVLASVEASRNINESHDEDVIQLDRFVEGCLNLKGNASCLDMQRQLAETHEVKKRIHQLDEDCRSALHDMNERLSASLATMAEEHRQNNDLASDTVAGSVPNTDSTTVDDECTSILLDDRLAQPSNQGREAPNDVLGASESMRQFCAELKEELSAQLVPQLCTAITRAVESQLRSPAETFVVEPGLSRDRHGLGVFRDSCQEGICNGKIGTKTHAALTRRHDVSFEGTDSLELTFCTKPQGLSKDAVNFNPDAEKVCLYAADQREDTKGVTDSSVGSTKRRMIAVPLGSQLVNATGHRDDIQGALVNEDMKKCPTMPPSSANVEEDTGLESVQRVQASNAAGSTSVCATDQVNVISTDMAMMREDCSKACSALLGVLLEIPQSRQGRGDDTTLSEEMVGANAG